MFSLQVLSGWMNQDEELCGTHKSNNFSLSVTLRRIGAPGQEIVLLPNPHEFLLIKQLFKGINIL